MVPFATHLKGNILDLILTNIPERFIEVRSEGRLGSSDHYMILSEVEVGSKRETACTFVRNWWKADWAAMKEELDSETWTGLDQMSASEAWGCFSSKIDALVEIYVPPEPCGKPGRPPWMTREILRAVRRKRRMWEKSSSVSAEYREAEKKVRNLIRIAKRSLERKLARENNGNSKPFYAYLKAKTKSKTPVGPLKDASGAAVSDK
jgi:hypothetical protein